ncbi:MAG: hypothetical protein K0R19_2597 [Bacillota bacterium]|jgi:hypothetical protein|nr:hypothetical protein [Bacillota bacterium]
MKSKMNNSSCGTNKNGTVNCTGSSSVDSTRSQGDLREFKNQGDMRDVTDYSGSQKRINMTNSDY